MEQSGATLAWDYFKQLALDSECVDVDSVNELFNPDLRQVFEYVEDHDLWKHEKKDSKAFTAGLALNQFNYDYNENPQIFDELYSCK